MSTRILSFVGKRKRLLSLIGTGIFSVSMLVFFLAPTSGTTYDFIMSNITIDADDTSPAAGFNLDGRYSTATDTAGCSVLDRISDLDLDQNQDGCSSTSPTCHGGVDNILPVLLHAIDHSLTGNGTPLRTRFASLLAAGYIVVLVRLEGVDSLTNDSDVVVSLYLGFSADTSCSALFGGSGQFYIANDTLTVSGDPTHPIWQAHGSIASGRLKVRYGSNSSLAAEAPMGFPVNQLTLRASLDSSGYSATNGNAGGWMPGTLLQEVAAGSYPRLRTIFHGIIPQMDDLPNLTSGNCGGDFNTPVGGAGLGIRFQLAQATILGTASSYPSGTCGAH